MKLQKKPVLDLLLNSRSQFKVFTDSLNTKPNKYREKKKEKEVIME